LFVHHHSLFLYKMHFTSLIAPVFALLGSVSGNSLAGRAAQLTQVQNFGDNPSGTGMYIYVPTKLAAKPPIIVAIHYCTGTAQAYYQGSPYAKLADQKGFIVIYPSSPHVSDTLFKLCIGMLTTDSERNLLGCLFSKVSEAQWWW
jgi:poly(3-hydroxybutyrate) depolymerase